MLRVDFLCPDDAMRIPTATINISNMLTSSMYVRLDDFLYSPKNRMPQKVLTKGSACHCYNQNKKHLCLHVFTLSTKLYVKSSSNIHQTKNIWKFYDALIIKN